MDETLKSTEGQKEILNISNSTAKIEGRLQRTDGIDLAMNIGCTACVALITKSDIYVANAGDSRSVLCRGLTAIAMSEDHKPDLAREKKRIEKAGGKVDDGRVNGIINLSRSLGDLEYKMDKKLSPAEQIISSVPELKIEKLTSDVKFLIIACDGIWDCLTNDQAVSILREKMYDSNNKPLKVSLGKAIGEVLDSIVAVDLENPGIAMTPINF